MSAPAVAVEGALLTARAERKWASRKVAVAILVVLLATLLCAWGRIADTVWGDVVKWVTGLYMLGNFGSSAVELLKGRA